MTPRQQIVFLAFLDQLESWVEPTKWFLNIAIVVVLALVVVVVVMWLT